MVVFWRFGTLRMQRRTGTLKRRLGMVGLFDGYGTTARDGVAAVRRPSSYCGRDHAHHDSAGEEGGGGWIKATGDLR